MARQNIDIGVQGNDGTGDSIRESFRKVNENFSELFAIFGQGDRIAFTDLDDAPVYGPNQVIISNADASSLLSKALVGGEGIQVDNEDDNEIRIIATGGKVSTDPVPSLGGHMDAKNFTIGNLPDPTDDVAADFNNTHNTFISADNLVITRGYADQRYLQTSGGPGIGSQVRVRSEPLDQTEYSKTITNWIEGYAIIPNHGFNTGSNGVPYKYFATIASATGLLNGLTYYLRFVDKNRLSLHPTRPDALDGTNRIIVNDPEIVTRGVETITDFFYDAELSGSWVSNEALPRKSTVRREGDTMTGALVLFDHPGTLAGSGSPTGPDDLQAATKYYVDNSSFASESNLFVSMAGDDAQIKTPPGKEGRAFAYAYETVGAACLKAEELIAASLSEPGPYRQLLTYANVSNFAYIENITTGAGSTRTLSVFSNGGGVDQSKDVANRDLREGSILKGIRSGATARVKTYNGVTGLNDIYVVELLLKETEVTNYTTDYKKSASRLLANKDFIKNEVVTYIKAKYPILGFDEEKCARDAGLIVDAIIFDITYGGNKKSIEAGRSYYLGVSSVLPPGQVSQTVDGIDYINLLAQQIITNTTIPPAPNDIAFGKRGLIPQNTSGDTGEADSAIIIERLVESIKNIVLNGRAGDGTLVEFIDGETLEFGQPVPEAQITVRVESGVYYEQFPIRVPTNVSIKGDEFRRVIIRPAPGTSTSPWAGMYFYRDDTFDGLTRTYTTAADAASSFVAESFEYSGSPAYWKITTADTDGLETGMYVSVIAGTGELAPATQVTRIINSTSFEISDQPLIALSGATVRGLNGSGLAPTGENFGYHYLTDPTGQSGIFSRSIVKTAGNTAAATLLTSNKLQIQSDVISYINTTYPTLVYDETLCSRDVGLIVDALIYDLTYGGVTRTLAAGASYKWSSSGRKAITTQLTETLDGINYINVQAQLILTGEPTAAAIVGDLINGIKKTIQGVNNPPKANKDMDVFLLNDGTILRNITAQGHGGFMCVLDPEGQIQTKSPYFQTATSLSGSVNKKSFRGGMFLDGFCGDLPATVASRISASSITLGGLTVRQPGIPTSFIIEGSRYQINAVSNYNRVAGTCTVTLDESTPWPVNNPTTGLPWVYPYSIIVGTPGNRSMLANDFTQVNDLGYGVVATNNAISELVSVFTYYNWTSYYSVNGGQIRSLNGSSCNGVYGLRAAGGDPREVPDPVALGDNVLQVVKIYKRGSFSARNNAGDKSIYIDNYQYAPFNISEIEIDHTPTKQSLVENTSAAPNNIGITAPGAGYQVDDILTVFGGVLFPSGLATQVRVLSVDGVTGGVTSIELIEPGTYAQHPGYPTSYNASLATTGGSGDGACTISGHYLGPITTYEVSNVELTTSIGVGVDPGPAVTTRTVLKLNLNTASASAGLVSSLVDGQNVIIRSLQNFRFTGVEAVKPVRPSTALEFTSVAEANQVYRTLAYGLTTPTGSPLPTGQAILSFDTSYNYVILQTNPSKLADIDYEDGGPKTMGANVADDKIAVQSISNASTIARMNSGDLLLALDGKLFAIASYTPINGTESAYISLIDKAYGEGSIENTFSPGLFAGLTQTRVQNIRAGIEAGAPAQITVNISTCRATGHDFLDIGSGGFNSTNYPSNILGSPVSTPIQSNEVVEETQGRVFYVSTDQDGIFRVGPFFTVDQGTGTVTFSASIALSNLDGIGFKRGVVAKEFSTDDTMTDNADDSVPVESAVQGYINRRLGFDRNGNPVTSSERLPAGGGFLPTFGSPVLEADLSMGAVVGHRITNLVYNAASSTDASTIGYVDLQVAAKDSFFKLNEVNVMTPVSADIPVFTGAQKSIVSATISGDISATLSSTLTATLDGGVTNFPTVDVGIIDATIASVAGGVVVNEDISTWPTSGHFRIGNEIFQYSGVTLGAKRFDGVTRSKYTTSGSDHAQGATVLSLENSTLDYQLTSGSVEDTDISATADIAQSKLLMQLSATSASAPTGTAAQKQAASGVASFDSGNFEITDGWVGIKAGGVALTEIQNIAANRILGNLTGSPAAPQEVTTGGIVQNGINNLFTSFDPGANVLTRRFNSLKVSSVFSSVSGNSISGSGTISSVPVTSLSGSGYGAIVNVGYSGGAYSGITVTFGGNGYAEGDQLFVDGKLLNGISGGLGVGNDLTFTVAVTGTNIDTTVYFGLTRSSSLGGVNSILRTDYLGNVGTEVNKLGKIYANEFNGGAALTGGTVSNLTGLSMSAGASITEFSTDTALSGNSNTAVPTEAAVKSYVDNNTLSSTGIAKFSTTGNITAAGTNQATATELDANINIVSNVASGTGVKLPTAQAGMRIIVRNSGTNNLSLYPAGAANINDTPDPFTIVAGTSLEFFCANSLNWYTINVTYG
jgi:hypothetical protein